MKTLEVFSKDAVSAFMHVISLLPASTPIVSVISGDVVPGFRDTVATIDWLPIGETLFNDQILILPDGEQLCIAKEGTREMIPTIIFSSGRSLTFKELTESPNSIIEIDDRAPKQIEQLTIWDVQKLIGSTIACLECKYDEDTIIYNQHGKRVSKQYRLRVQ